MAASRHCEEMTFLSFFRTFSQNFSNLANSGGGGVNPLTTFISMSCMIISMLINLLEDDAKIQKKYNTK